jgi:hypothetical protein
MLDVRTPFSIWISTSYLDILAPITVKLLIAHSMLKNKLVRTLEITRSTTRSLQIDGNVHSATYKEIANHTAVGGSDTA